MRRRQGITHLQKPKRIRKNKKDFLRGSIEHAEPKVIYANASVPIPYIVLFLALSATIIGYISINFLFAKIQVNTSSVFTPLLSDFSMIRLPHIALPPVALPSLRIPAIAIPPIHMALPSFHVSLPLISFNLTPLFQWISSTITAIWQTLREQIILLTPVVTSWINPFPFWIEVTATTIQAVVTASTLIGTYGSQIILRLGKTIQNDIVSFTQIIHPMETIITAMQQTGYAIAWLGNTFLEYLILLRGILLLTAITIWQITTTIIVFLVHANTQHSEYIKQSINILYGLIENSILSMHYLQSTMTNICIAAAQTISIVIWDTGVMIYNALVFIVETIFLFIWHVLSTILDWIVNIILAIKKSIDQTIAAIASVIHLGDPIYRVIGESINELVTAMGATITAMPKALK